MNPTLPGAEARLLVIGDTHGNGPWVSHLIGVAVREHCDGIIQLGDFGVWPGPDGQAYLDFVNTELERARLFLVFIDGNHEWHDELDRLLIDHLHSEPPGMVPVRDSIHWAHRGWTWEWCGVEFGALGGAVSIDQAYRVPGVSWWPQEKTTLMDVERLGEGKLDVLLTHDSPAGAPVTKSGRLKDVHLEISSHEVRQLVRQAVDETRPDLLLHGHWHQRVSARLDQTRIEGLASDQEHNGGSWGILELPSLTFRDGHEVER